MQGLTIQRVLEALAINQPPGAEIASITLYTIAFLALVALLLSRNSSTLETVLVSSVILLVLVDKITFTSNLSGVLNLRGFTTGNPFGIFLVRVAMVGIPWMVAGLTKSEKARGPLILCGVIGLVYFFARWFFEIMPR